MKFEIRYPTGGAHRVEFPGTLISVGRDPACDLVLSDSKCSRRHAVIEEGPSGLVVRDTGSANGVFLNGKKIERAALEEGDLLRMGEVIIWRLFNEAAIKPYVWGQPTDEAVLRKTLDEDLPHVLDYLESQVPAERFVCGALSIADVAIATFFRNARFARFQVDAERWPRTAAFVERVLGLACFQKLQPFEDRMMKTPPVRQRAALAEMGAPLTAESYATATPRRGVMPI